MACNALCRSNTTRGMYATAARSQRISRWRRPALAAVASAALAVTANAQSISYNGGTYSQNFDGLPNSGTFTFTGTGPFLLSNAPINATGLEGWSFAKVGGTGANALFAVDNGNSTTGRVYSYGSTGSTERAYGMLLSGTTASTIGAVLFNNSGTTYNALTITYTGEQWRRGNQGGVADQLLFEYSVGAGDIISGGFTSFSGLDFSSPQTASSGSLNGNNAANRTTITATITGFNWAPGQTLAIRWSDLNIAGSDDGLAIDDFSLAASVSRNLIWNPPGNNWNTDPGNTNWLDGASSTSFMNGDVANFTDAGLAAGSTVNIDAGGIAPAATNVSNTTGTYTFIGGSIGGTGGLTKTGAGTLVLNNSNTFASGLTVNDGFVVVSSDAALGAAAANVTMGGGTLIAAASITGTRGVQFTDATFNNIDTASNTVTLGGTTGGGSVTKLGSGTLIFTGGVSHTGFTTLAGGTLVLAQTGGAVNLKTFFNGNDFSGDLVVTGPARVNFNDGIFGGAGKIWIKASGAQISNTGANLQTIINKDIVLNPDNLAGPFVTFIGGVGGHETIFNNPISGASDVNFASSPSGGGAGTLILNAAASYTGATYLNHGGATPATVDNTDPNNPIITAPGFPAGTIKLGLDNALPVTTDVISNTIANPNNGPGRIDLNGFSQMISSLSTGTGSGSGVAEITNFGTNNSTLTISGSNSPTTAFNGILTDGPTNTLALVKDGTNTVQLSGVYPARYTWANDTTANGGTFVPVRPYSGGTYVRGGTLIAPEFSHGTLSVTGGVARVSVKTAANDPAGTTRVPALSVSGSGRLDLNNNSLIVDGGNLANVTAWLKTGLENGGNFDWLGPGIGSTQANVQNTTAGSFLFGLGVVLNDLSQVGGTGPIYTDFAGKSGLDGDEVLVKFTYFGDADLSGSIDATDYSLIDNGYVNSLSGWLNGDFDYSGTIDATDYALIDNAYVNQVGPLANAIIAEHARMLGGEYLAALRAIQSGVIPEPTSVGLLAAAAWWLAGSRRRR